MYEVDGRIRKIAEAGVYLPEGVDRISCGPSKAREMRNPIKRAIKPSKTEMLVVFNDTQLYRQCDQEALGAFLKFVSDYRKQITHIVGNGDILDLENLSKFPKQPDNYNEGENEIIAGRFLFSVLADMLPNAEKRINWGNHDQPRHDNLTANTVGVKEWVKSMDEQFDLTKQGWDVIPYGKGHYYQWHNRIFWHGVKCGAKANNAKSEQEDAGVATTTGHTNKNEFWQTRTALGITKTSYSHAGFSKDNLDFVKKANSGWQQGFGIYFWDKGVGETVVPIMMQHGTPRFRYEGKIYDGTGYAIPMSGKRSDMYKGLK